MARPTPVFPDVGSTIVPPAVRCPARSAARSWRRRDDPSRSRRDSGIRAWPADGTTGHGPPGRAGPMACYRQDRGGSGPPPSSVRRPTKGAVVTPDGTAPLAPDRRSRSPGGRLMQRHGGGQRRRRPSRPTTPTSLGIRERTSATVVGPRVSRACGRCDGPVRSAVQAHRRVPRRPGHPLVVRGAVPCRATPVSIPL